MANNYRRPRVGQFVPHCEPNGLYSSIQVNPSTEEAWCVNVATGKEIPDTRKSAENGMPTCPG